MAQPGESFPAEFALGILNLAQQRKIKAIDLAEMRSARAAQNFMDKERIALAERAQSLAEFQAGTTREQVAAQAEVQKAAQLARITIETKKIEAERNGQVVAALGNFGRTGTAFIPSWASDKIPQLTSSSSEFGIATIPIPGLGTLVQRVSDPKLKADLAETQSKIDLNNQQIAVGKARQDYLKAQTDYEIQKSGSVVGKLGGPEAVRAVTSMYENYNERARKLASSLSFGDDAAQARGRLISLNPSEAFKDNPKDAKTYGELTTLMGSISMAMAQGLDLNKTRTDFRALEAAGLSDTFVAAHNFAASQAPPEKIVGKVTIPWGKESGQQYYQVFTDSGRKIDVDRETYLKTVVGSKLGGGSAAPPAQGSAPAPAPKPSGPSEEQRSKYKEELTKLFDAYDKATGSQKDAIAEQINFIKQRLIQ